MKTDIKIRTVNGDLPVEVDSHGRFVTDMEGVSIYADSLQALTDKVRGLAKTMVRMEVPGTKVIHPRWDKDAGKIVFEDVVITGIHSSNNNLMIKLANGKTVQSGFGDRFLLRLSKGQQAEYLGLVKAKRDAEAAFDKFEKLMRMPDDREPLLKLWNALKHKDAPKAKK